MTYYLDTSAVVKLLVNEDESSALRGFLEGVPKQGSPFGLASSELLRTELLCAIGQRGTSLTEARRLLASLHLIRVSPAIADYAGRLCRQIRTRSLDSLHLATALSLVDSLRAVVTYDRRMIAAASELGISVVHPGVID